MGWSVLASSIQLGLIFTLFISVSPMGSPGGSSPSWAKYVIDVRKYVGCAQGLIPNCLTCAAPYIASNCPPGTATYHGEKGCEPCTASCEVCHIDTTRLEKTFCDKCGLAYKLVDGYCRPCSVACWDCYTYGQDRCDGNCTRVVQGRHYVYNDNTRECEACDINCKSCENENRGKGKCDDGQCKTGFALASPSFTCVPCDLNCLNCDTNGRDKCDSGQCKARYAFDSTTKTCLPCASWCKSCSVHSQCDSGQCETHTTYNIGTKICDLCWTVTYIGPPPLTYRCTDCNNQGGGFCDTHSACPDRFALDSLYRCAVCGANCLECHSNGPGFCDPGKCREGYVFSNKQCLACAVNCKECPATQLTCINCRPGFLAKSREVCQVCPDHCQSCTLLPGYSKCKSDGCESGFTEALGLCRACPSNCALCTYRVSSNKVACTTCNARFALDAVDELCHSCPTGCSSCTYSGGTTRCLFTQCQTRTTYDYRTGLCRACPANCDKCTMDDDKVVCTQCANKYAPTANFLSCLQCPTNCLRCEVDGSVTRCLADQCRLQYVYRSTGVCDGCPAGCAVCSVNNANAIVCSGTCIAGYAFNPTSQQCVQCANCAACSWGTSGIECSSCNSLFVLGGTTCHSCPAGCPTTCQWVSNAVTCPTVTATGCATGTVQVSNSLCLRCPPNCDTCTLSGVSLTCTACKSGYRAVGSKCLPCPDYCTTCTFNIGLAATTCTTCQTGYALTTTGTCSACGSSCSSCTTPGTCSSSCSAGYYYNTGDQSCQLCGSNCATCTSGNPCLTCNTGFFLVGTSCQGCPSQCASCVSATTCSTCNAGYIVNSGGTGCTQCPAGCGFCALSGATSICLYGACLPGYVMKSDRSCVACTTGCAQCEYDSATSGTKCFSTACRTGFVYNGNGGCVACPSYCRYCTWDGSSSKCETLGCAPRHYLAATGQCLACGTSCQRCTSTQCSACDEEFYLTTTFTCLACPANCLSCNTGGALSQCDSCKTGYLKTGSNQCVIVCASGCGTCTTPNECEATGCNAGMTYVGGNTISPNTWCVTDADFCEPNCGNLVTDCARTGYQKCDPGRCNAGYGFDKTTQKCGPCQSGCAATIGCNWAGAGKCDANGCSRRKWWTTDKTCISAVACSCDPTKPYCETATTCAFGGACPVATKYVGSKCEACPSGCLVCDNAAVNCEVCKTGYYKDAAANCIACSSGCSDCTATDCTRCSEGFVIVAGPPNTCQQCAIAGCRACDGGAASCEMCMDGFYRASATQCTACSEGCASCFTGNTVCDHCKDGYVASGTSCLACISNCQKCATAGSGCLKCNSGYFYNAGSCQPCPENCPTCDHNGNGGCDSCGTGNWWDSTNQACIPCDLHCAACTASAQCTTCKDGFFLSGTTCVACSVHCKTCSSATACTACMDGYLVVGGACVACPAHCKTCSSATACTACMDGYGVVGGACVACQQGCAKGCSVAEGACAASTDCRTGFWLDGTTCKKCRANCDVCTTGADCTTCNSLYYDDGVSACAFCPLHATCPGGVVTCTPANDVYGTKIYFGDTAATPTQCNYGYTNRGCGSATRPVTVTSCPGGCATGYFLDAMTSQCWPDSTKCPNCNLQYCTDAVNSYCASTQCTGNYGQDTNGLCVACHANCQSRECTVAGSCLPTKCNSRFTAGASEGPCQACASNCLSCETAGAGGCDANMCEARYAYDATGSGSCKEVACDAGNKQVRADGSGCVVTPLAGCLAPKAGTVASTTWSCTEAMCAFNYRWDSATSTCTSCPAQCHNCKLGASICLNSGCEFQHTTSNSFACASCPIGCSRCTYDTSSSSTVCVNAYCFTTGFVQLSISTATCFPCPSSCTTCAIAANEIRCSSGGCNSQQVLLPTHDNVCYPCSTSCNTCSFDGQRARCSACVAATALNSNEYCTGCPANCRQCTFDTTNALKCDQGYCNAQFAQSPTTGNCYTCPTGCQYCQHISTTNNPCFQGACAIGYAELTLATGGYTCQGCPTGCKRCERVGTSNTYICIPQQCEDGYGHVASTGTCIACPNGCRKCLVSQSGGTQTITCTSCFGRYVMSGTTCYECPTNCLSCTYSAAAQQSQSVTICNLNACDPGFTQLADTRRTCGRCPTNCQICASVTQTAPTLVVALQCTVCHVGFQTNSLFGCTSCPNNCAACDNTGTCTSCGVGYRLDTTNQNVCERCDINCNNCNNAGAGLCDAGQCHALYAFNSATSKCDPCGGSCLICTSSSVCTSCGANHVLSNTGVCVQCPANCNSCTWNGNNAVCVSNGCHIKHYLTTDGKCDACPSQCTVCGWSIANSRVECSACNIHYGLDSVSLCSECPTYCISCAHDVTSNRLVCTDCEQYYALNTYICAVCPKNCASCSILNGALTCVTCRVGYYLTTNSRSLKYCEVCPPNCVRCNKDSGALVCTECTQPGFNYTVNNLCSSCPTLTGVPNCGKCTRGCSLSGNFGQCERCAGGYTLSPDGSSCDSCAQLPGTSSCRYTLANTRCSSCRQKDGVTYSLSDKWTSCAPKVRCHVGFGPLPSRDFIKLGASCKYGVEINSDGNLVQSYRGVSDMVSNPKRTHLRYTKNGNTFLFRTCMTDLCNAVLDWKNRNSGNGLKSGLATTVLPLMLSHLFYYLIPRA